MPRLSHAQDWANSNYYKKENAILGSPSLGENRIVFMGNSITEGWKSYMPEFFEKRSYVNRGIGGQTTPQMLLRFKTDVIDLHPTILIILAGINDIAQNTGPISLKETSENIITMVEQARKNNIKVIISSVLPAFDFPWRPGLEPANKVINLNEILKSYANQNEIFYLDYFSSMVDKKNGLKRVYTYDGVHPNKEGYLIMTQLVNKAIGQVLSNIKLNK